MKHSKLSPSAMRRLLACNYSINAPEGKASFYSAQGTYAHSLIDDYFCLGLSPDLAIGDTVEVDGFTVEVTEEMVRCVRDYIGYIESLSMLYGHPRSDKRIIHSEIPDFGGPVDCHFPDTEQLVIVDYKHGAGVFVDVEQNEQL
jgi:hypothetical protein